jgi:hypothetical protein
MHGRIFSALVAKPIAFPDDLQFFIVPLRHDGTKIGPSYTMQHHDSWEWVQRRYPVNSEDEAHIKAGESIRVFTGTLSAEFPDGFEFPQGSTVEIFEP